MFEFLPRLVFLGSGTFYLTAGPRGSIILWLFSHITLVFCFFVNMRNSLQHHSTFLFLLHTRPT